MVKFGFGGGQLPNYDQVITRSYAYGTNGNDTIVGQWYSYNTIYSYGGDDTAVGGQYADEFYLYSGNDYAYGYGGDDVFFGGYGDDRLFGDAGADTLNGEHGDDFLDGGAGGDVIDGGFGVDTLSYRYSNAAVEVSVTFQILGGSSVTATGGFATGDEVQNIEYVEGSSYGDEISFEFSASASFTPLSAGGVAWGLAGNDTLRGSDAADFLYGGNHNDFLEGGYGVDNLFGEHGHDVLVDFGAHNLALISASERQNDNDFMFGGDGEDMFFSYAGADEMFGQNGDDTFVVQVGADGGDYISGGSGVDTLVAQSGVLSYESSAGVYVDLDQGFAWLNFYGVASGVTAARSDDLGAVATLNSIENVEGSRANDWLFGSWRDEELSGREGDDYLLGRGGRDVLSGGEGYNWMDGGSGQDQIHMTGDTDIAMGGADEDVFIVEQEEDEYGLIYDFQDGLDRVDLTNTDISNYSDLLSATDGDGLIDDGAGYVMLSTVSDGAQLVIYGLTIDTMSSADFIF